MADPRSDTRKTANRYVKQVLDSGILSGARVSAPNGGPFVCRLEAWFQQFYQTRHAVAFSSASTALYAALRAVGVGFGDRVLVPAYTMSASASAVIMCGATPVFVDVDPTTGLAKLDDYVEGIGAVHDESGGLPAAIMLVHIHGQPAPTAAYRTAFSNVPIIEDCSQSFNCYDPDTHDLVGGKSSGQHVAVFSLKQGKALSAGEGGIAITNDNGCSGVLRKVRNHGEVVDEDVLGFNLWMPELTAAVALAECEHTAYNTKAAWMHSRALTQRLRQDVELYVPMPVHGPPFLYTLTRRDLRSPVPRGFTAGYHTPLCCLPWYRKNLKQTCCLNAHVYQAHMLWTTPPETACDVDRLVEAVQAAEDSCS